MRQLTNKQLAFVRAARVAHLATADAAGQPLVIPICFVLDGKEFFSPIDEKPKRTSPTQLKRLRNIAENPKVCLIIDRYDEDWRRLLYVLITGKGKVIFRGERHKKAVKLLRRKYTQYRRMAIHQRPVISIKAHHVKVWGNPR
jgi:PPOX class probable F420-dependent enzyme